MHAMQGEKQIECGRLPIEFAAEPFQLPLSLHRNRPRHDRVPLSGFESLLRIARATRWE